MSIIELSSMAKELGLHGSNLYSVKCGREYKDIKTDMNALELYKYLDGKRVVHVYVEPNVATILGGIETSIDGEKGSGVLTVAGFLKLGKEVVLQLTHELIEELQALSRLVDWPLVGSDRLVDWSLLSLLVLV
ncbi:hypothetical protein Droror1_Dr00000986 [Drosera rotundifolia]